MKVGDLVNIWWNHERENGLVLKIKRRTCIVMSNTRGIQEIDRGHVGVIEK